MAKISKQSPVGTSFFNTTFKASPNNLIKLFGENEYGDNSGEDKTNLEWTLETDDGKVFTIYDWKYYKPLNLNKEYKWHIGAHNAETSEQAKLEVCNALIDLYNSNINKHTKKLNKIKRLKEKLEKQL